MVEWQTRKLEVLVGATPCWFKSSCSHQKRTKSKPKVVSIFLLYNYFFKCCVIFQCYKNHLQEIIVPFLLLATSR